MRLMISHQTEYEYEEPVEFALQRLRLTPKTGPGQSVSAWQTSVTGAHPEASFEDHFGNVVQLVSITGNPHSINIMAAGTVDTEDRSGVFGPHLGFVPLWLFRRETELTKPGKQIRDFAREIRGETELEKLHALMEAINTSVEYKGEVTGSQTTAEQALELGAGVCQDHTHIFLSAARSMGFPARYVSGYMYDSETRAAASHAWAEAYINALGWVGFDAANKVCPDDRYVRLATGLDYTDAAPVSGMRLGNSPEMITVTVSIETE